MFVDHDLSLRRRTESPQGAVDVGEGEVATTTATAERRPTVLMVAAVITADAMIIEMEIRIKIRTVAVVIRMAIHLTTRIRPTQTIRTAHEAGLGTATGHLVVEVDPEAVEATTLATRTAARMATAPVVTEAEAGVVDTEVEAEVEVDMADTAMAVVAAAMVVIAVVMVVATTVATEATAAAAMRAMVATDPAEGTLLTQVTAAEGVMGLTVEAAAAAVTQVLNKMAMVVVITAAVADSTRVAAQGDTEPLGPHLHCMSIVKLFGRAEHACTLCIWDST